MKTLLQKKHIRRLFQAALLIVSLLALSWAAFNWRGAVLKRSAIARLEAHGWPSDMEDVLGGMPPDESNYAMIPLLREAREQMAIARTTVRSGPPDPSTAEGRLAALFEEDFRSTRRRRGDPLYDQPDFSRLPAGNPYGQTAGSFLLEYDRRNAEALRELTHALPLPFTRLPIGAAKGADWFTLTEVFGMNMRRTLDGIGLRGYAAIETGDSARAADSIVLMLRLGDVVGSRGFGVSLAIQRVSISAAALRVKQGLLRQVWTEADLRRIRDAFTAIRIRERADTSMSFTARCWADSWSQWEGNREGFREISSMLSEENNPWNGFICHIIPAGWFDLNAADAADRWMELDRFNQTATTLLPIFSHIDNLKKQEVGRHWMAKAIEPHFDILTAWHMTTWVVFAEITIRQTLLAIELDLQRLATGTYPDTLATIPAALTIDPLHGTPFIYRREGDTFILYSLGQNAKDDGGKSKGIEPPWKQPDCVW